MRKTMKIGLSALAGALAMTSVNAGEMSLSGSIEASYTTGSGYVTTGGQRLGMDKELTVKGSAELDNGTAVNYKQTITDAMAFNDSEIAFVTDGWGTITIGSAGAPISGIDNVTPTAYEEAEAGLTTGLDDVNGADGDMGIRYTLADIGGTGFKFDAFITSEHGSADANADNAGSGEQYNNNGAAYEWVITGDAPGIEGLAMGIGYAKLEVENTDTQTVKPSDVDNDEGTAYLTYANGPFKVGYQKSAVNIGSTNTLHKTDYYSVSYAATDNLSVSYSVTEAQRTKTDGLQQNQDMDGISIAYTMGGMTISVADNDCSDCSYTAGRSEDYQTMSVAVAF